MEVTPDIYLEFISLMCKIKYDSDTISMGLSIVYCKGLTTQR